ncbi:MAG TPA: GatB/YqeY domain-containing protein [Patescibacteria group bacterium]|nr:GatB/YqeY domain-containing protein [Patescibacteria group bacterium]
MEDRLRQDLKQAQLSRDELKVATLRLLLSEITYAKVSKQTESLSNEDVISVIQKAVKQRKESIESFEKGGRVDLAEKEKAELAVLQAYLPEQISDEELTKVIDEAITNTGASSMTDMGKVIGMVMGRVGQRAEGARVSALVREKLTK